MEEISLETWKENLEEAKKGLQRSMVGVELAKLYVATCQEKIEELEDGTGEN